MGSGKGDEWVEAFVIEPYKSPKLLSPFIFSCFLKMSGFHF